MLRAKLLQAEFDAEAIELKAAKAIASDPAKAIAAAVASTAAAGRGWGTKRQFGLLETGDGRRRTARKLARVDYSEMNFAVIDSDDDVDDEASDVDEALMRQVADDDRHGAHSLFRWSAQLFVRSDDAWKPRADEDDEEFAAAAQAMVDGKPVCKFGAACFRKNPDHLKQFHHPAK